MSCFKPKDPKRRASKEIDKKIASWMREYTKAIKLLLLGAAESGKTTILKQMKILHIQGFSESERLEKVEHIRRNVLEAIKELTGNMLYLKPKVTLVDPNNQDSLSYIFSIDLDHEFHYPQEFFDHVARLWADPGIQECFRRSNEFPLIDSAKYFLDKVDEVRRPDYRPSDLDILWCRKRTNEIQKVEFKMKVPKKYGGGSQVFWMFDVGGQRGERRKWIQVFDGITAILFLVACGAFDMRIREDNMTNRIDEALQLFEDIWFNRFLREAGTILFLNKQDVLKEKIEAGARLEYYFPDYTLYNIGPSEGELTEYNRARCYIRDRFLEISRRPPQRRKFSTTDMFMENELKSWKRECYWHYTTATDSGNIKKVFEDVHTMIVMWNLDKITPN